MLNLRAGNRGPPEFVFLLTDDEKVLDLAPLYRGDYFEHLRGILPRHLWRQVSVQEALPHSELAEHYRMSDIFIGPSVWNEPFGMVIVEAMASGLPVIATRGGGFPEIVKDGETGSSRSAATLRGSPKRLPASSRTMTCENRWVVQGESALCSCLAGRRFPNIC